MVKDIDLIAVGYPSLDRIIKTTENLSVGNTTIIQNSDNSKIYYGGCNVNIAYTCARLTLNASLMMRVGSDFESTGYSAFLKDAEINLDGVQAVEDDVTSNTYLIENSNGNHITLFYPGAMSDKYQTVIDRDMIRRAKFGVITVGNLEYNREFAKVCVEEGVPIVFGMKCDFESFNKDSLKMLLSSSSIIFMNQGERVEIEKLFGLQDISDLFNNKQCRCIVITQGKEGSLLMYKDMDAIAERKIPVVRPEKIVDTSGVGDSYIAGFIYGLIKDKPYDECGRLGSTVASFIIEEMGCLTNSPNEKRLEERYINNFK